VATAHRPPGADDQQLRSIVFTGGTSLDRSVLYVHPPSRQATTFAADLGCRLLDDGSVEVDDLGHTSVPGVHAAGDMARRPTMPVPGEQVAIDQELVLTDMPTSSTD
jgi:thioredoxin reductase